MQLSRVLTSIGSFLIFFFLLKIIIPRMGQLIPIVWRKALTSDQSVFGRFILLINSLRSSMFVFLLNFVFFGAQTYVYHSLLLQLHNCEISWKYLATWFNLCYTWFDFVQLKIADSLKNPKCAGCNKLCNVIVTSISFLNHRDILVSFSIMRKYRSKCKKKKISIMKRNFLPVLVKSELN